MDCNFLQRRFSQSSVGAAGSMARRLHRRCGAKLISRDLLKLVLQPVSHAAITMIMKIKSQNAVTAARMDRKLKILLVEDTPAIRDLLVKVLESPNSEVVVAADGAEAFSLFCHDVFDVVVTDIRMPILNGQMATRFMRQFEQSRPEIAPVPIIAISANATDADREKCFAAGVNAFVSKPIDLANLLKTVEHLTRLAEGDLAASKIKGNKQIRLFRSKEPPKEAVFDWKGALARLADDKSLLNQMVRIYQSDHHDLIGEIRSAVDQADLQVAARHAHSLKGLAATIGGNEVVDAAKAFEHAAKSDSMLAAETAVEQILLANSKLLEHLN